MGGPAGHTSQLVAFAVAGDRYAVPLASVERVLLMVAVPPVPGAPRVVLGAINVEGQVVPVVDLGRRLGLPERDYGPEAHLLILQTSRRRLGLPADEVTGVVEIDARSVAPSETILPGLGRVAGIAALPSGLLFIHDIEAFLTPEEERDVDRALGRAET